MSSCVIPRFGRPCMRLNLRAYMRLSSISIIYCVSLTLIYVRLWLRFLALSSSVFCYLCVHLWKWSFYYIILRSHSYCLSPSPLCLEWYKGSITPRVHSGVTSVRLRPSATVGISVLNNCLEWDKFVRLTLTYPTPDSCLTYTLMCISNICWNFPVFLLRSLYVVFWIFRHEDCNISRQCFLVIFPWCANLYPLFTSLMVTVLAFS